MVKYQNEYDLTQNKKDFVELVLNKYPTLKRESAERRFYELRKSSFSVLRKNKPFSSSQLSLLLNNEDIARPSPLQMLILRDMKHFKQNLTDEFLLKHGFKPVEIRWLKINNLIGIEKNDEI